MPDLNQLTIIDNILFFDTETSIFNKGHPYDPRNKIVSYTLHANSRTCFKYYLDLDFISVLRANVLAATVIVGFNLKFDLAWLKRIGINIPSGIIIWDLQLAEFIYSGQELRYDSLDAALKRYDLAPKKKDLIADYWNAGIPTEDIPVEIVEEYNTADVYPALIDLYKVQQKLLNDKQKRLVVLEGEDLKALLAAEYAGIKFDVAKARELLHSYGSDLHSIITNLSRYLPDGIPDGAFNWDSGDDISLVLYGGVKEYKYVSEVCTYKSGERVGQQYNRYATTVVTFPPRFKPLEGTEVKKTRDDPNATTRYYQIDAPTLIQLKSRKAEDKLLLGLLQEWADKQKVVTMVQSIINKMEEKHWENDMIHGQFNQNVVITGRLSSSQPNLQNTPPEVDALLISRYD